MHLEVAELLGGERVVCDEDDVVDLRGEDLLVLGRYQQTRRAQQLQMLPRQRLQLYTHTRTHTHTQRGVLCGNACCHVCGLPKYRSMIVMAM